MGPWRSGSALPWHGRGRGFDSRRLHQVYAEWYTCWVSQTIPAHELRSELSQIIDRVADLREHVIVTRRGRPAAVLVPVGEYEALEETAEILSDPETLAAVEDGLDQAQRGETVSLETLRRSVARARRPR